MTIIERCFFMCAIYAVLTYISIVISYYLEGKKDSVPGILGSFFFVLASAACFLSSFACGLIGLLIVIEQYFG